jgi:transposase
VTSISVRIDIEPGVCAEIDWAGDALYIYDPVSELKIKTSLFVATLSFSDYFYAEAFLDQKVRSWIYGHVNALQFFGGVPAILTPDNTKTAVIKSDKYEPDIHEAIPGVSRSLWDGD